MRARIKLRCHDCGEYYFLIVNGTKEVVEALYGVHMMCPNCKSKDVNFVGDEVLDYTISD